MQPSFLFHAGATLSVLAFVGTAGVLGMAGVALVILLSRGSGYAARWVATGAAVVAGAYLAALAGVSLASDTRIVQPGEARYFCEIDCHLAYSVAGVRRVESLGALRPSRGAWEVVTLRVRSDASSTPSTGAGRPLTPDPREVYLVDAEGNRHAPSAQGLRALEAAGGARPPLTRPLRPGESYATTLVFDVPAGVPSRSLRLTETGPVTRLLIGHEGSLLHAPTLFRLPIPATSLAEAES